MTNLPKFILFFFLNYLAALGLSCGTQDLWLWHVGSSSLNRDQMWVPSLGSRSPSHWTTREVLPKFPLDLHVI